MWTFVKIAWRDLWRHRLRTSLTLGAIVFGTAMTLFVMAFARGEHVQMIRAAIDFFPGHLQVHRAGFQADQTLMRTMTLEPELVDWLERTPFVTGYSARLCTETLVQAGSNLSGSKICGVVPRNEIKTSRVAQSFFPEMIRMPRGVKTSRRYRGAFLSGAAADEAVLGEDLAKNLQVEAGDELSILSQDYYGSIAAGNFKVTGVFHVGSPEYDNGLMLVNLAALQDLLVMPGQVSLVAVTTKDPERIARIKNRIYGSLSRAEGPWKVLGLGSGLWVVRPMRPNLEPDSFFQLSDVTTLKDCLKRMDRLKGSSLQLRARLMFQNTAVNALGVVPEDENSISGIFSQIPARQDWALLDSGLAQKSGLKPGDRLTLRGTSYLGENFEMTLSLAGIFEPGPAREGVYLPLGFLQDKLRLGANVNQALLRFSPKTGEAEARAMIFSRLNYELIPWQGLIPDLVQLLTLDSVGAVLWLLILLIVIAFVFLLTILMSVLERARQFAIMKAIGTRPAEVFLIIFLESVMLGLLGTLIGLVVGAIPSLYFTFIPLQLASITEYMEEMGFEPFIYAKLESRMFFYTMVINFAIVLVMTVFPALRASRTTPVQSLRLQ